MVFRATRCVNAPIRLHWSCWLAIYLADRDSDQLGSFEVATTVTARLRMSLEKALSILQVVGIIGVLLASFQIRDRLDKLNQQLEKK